MGKGSIHTGISGWSYQDWKGIFYPEKLKSTDWLAFYAKAFSVTEINSSFYHLPQQKTVENWVNKVPDDFLFCPKMSRYLTHIKQIHEPEETLERFFRVFKSMQLKMGPVLIQLPPSLIFDYSRTEHLYTVLSTQYSNYTFALEARHATWLTEESIALMKRYNIVFVISQSGHGFPYGEHITSDNVYVRFHGPGVLYKSNYSMEMLEYFAVQFKKWSDQGQTVWAFFNNCYYGNAINNAHTIMELVKE